MIDIPKGKDGVHGTWHEVKRPKMFYCEFTCPFGHGGSLNKRIHTVADDGTVSPSLICPQEKNGCTFHEFVRLVDWKREYGEYGGR